MSEWPPSMELTLWDGTPLPWAQFAWFMAKMAADEPGVSEVIYGARKNADHPTVWIQVLTLPSGMLAIEVGSPKDDMY